MKKKMPNGMLKEIKDLAHAQGYIVKDHDVTINNYRAFYLVDKKTKEVVIKYMTPGSCLSFLQGEFDEEF
jgi:hypothetical protein